MSISQTALRTTRSERRSDRPSSQLQEMRCSLSAGKQPQTITEIRSGRSGLIAEIRRPIKTEGSLMSPKEMCVRVAVFALLVSGGHRLFADDLVHVLSELDKAAANFHSTTADFEFDTIQTDPFPDKDVQKGTAYYERKGSAFSMAAHINNVNGKPVPKIYTFTGGQFKLDDVMNDQVITYKRASKFESYVMLGFGASGKDLSE